MIDINELRPAVEAAGLNAISMQEVLELLDSLGAAEKEVAHIKEVEFPRKVRAVAIGWKTKCARREQERDALRAELLDAKETVRELFHGAGVANMTIATLQARVEAMEKQEPVGEVVHNGESAALYDILEQGALVYSLPGAQPELNLSDHAAPKPEAKP